MNDLQHQLETLTIEARAALGGAANALVAGAIDTDQFAAIVMHLLLRKHTAAVTIGRHLAGDYATEDSGDEAVAQTVAEDERQYLNGFTDDIRAGRYDAEQPETGPPVPKLGRERIIKRLLWYAGRLTGTANYAWVHASDPAAQFWWRLGANEDHCDACPELAAASPWTSETLPTVPGANHTPCLFNCKCHLERIDGVSGFETVPAAEAGGI